MRATLTVSAPEGPNKPCKVTLKLWDVPRPLLRKLAVTCDDHQGGLHRRELLDGAADIVCRFEDRSVTMVKPSREVHGLQARFEALVGKSLAYRIAPLQEASRKCATEGSSTTQEGNLEGCSPEAIFDTIHRASIAAATAQSAERKQRRPKNKKKRRGLQVATAA